MIITRRRTRKPRDSHSNSSTLGDILAKAHDICIVSNLKENQFTNIKLKY